MVPRALLSSVVLFLLGVTACAGEPQAPAENAALRAQLEKPVAVDFPNITLGRALELLARRGGFALQVTEPTDQTLQREIHFSAESVRPIDLLTVFGEMYRIEYQLTERGVRIGRPGDPRHTKLVFRAYNVNDLVSPLPKDISEDAHNSNSAPTLTNIADMIRNRVRPDQWDAALGTSIEERGGLLCIINTEEIHSQIRAMLGAFRVKQTRQVAIETRLISVRSIDLDRIRAEADARGVSRPILDDVAIDSVAAMLRDGSATQIYSGQGTVFNMSRLRLESQRTMQLSKDVNVSGDIHEPSVQDMVVGTTIRALPMLSDDSQWITLDIVAKNIEPRGVEDVAVQRGGLTRVESSGSSTITVKKKPAKDAEKKEPETEYEIESQQPGQAAALPTSGPLHCQMASWSYSRISQDLQLRSGQTAAVSAPMHGANGIEHGREMLMLVKCTALAGPVQKREEYKPVERELQESVRKGLDKLVTFNFVDTPFHKAIEAISLESKVPILLFSERVRERFTKSVNLNVRDVSAREALKQVLEQGGATTLPFSTLLWLDREEFIKERYVTLRVFDIRDMTSKFEDRLGELNGPISRDEGRIIANPFSTAPSADFVSSNLQAADFATIIKERIHAVDFISPATSVEESAGSLVVQNTPEALDRIEKTLNSMRNTGRQPIVLTTRWAVVNTSELEEAFGKSPAPQLDANQAAAALKLISQPTARDLAATRFVCFTGQRMSAIGGASRDYVRAYTTSGSVSDPEMDTVRGGVMADLAAQIMEGTGEGNDAVQFRIDTRLVMIRPDMKPQGWDIYGAKPPIAAFPPAMGLVHQPTNDHLRFFTSVRVPNGGAALFRVAAPAWIEGEKAEELKRGQRTLIVLLHAVQQKL